ncbi:unnamed protein product [Durusdinium trenchii]|uniref:Uncharacterized protein n=1 Tax=Durusdinium trenchii TaxID=1381693 RepID=A0ABP0PIT1_9DINO
MRIRPPYFKKWLRFLFQAAAEALPKDLGPQHLVAFLSACANTDCGPRSTTPPTADGVTQRLGQRLAKVVTALSEAQLVRATKAQLKITEVRSPRGCTVPGTSRLWMHDPARINTTLPTNESISQSVNQSTSQQSTSQPVTQSVCPVSHSVSE